MESSRVQVSGGLVRQKQGRVIHQSSGDGDALLFAAGRRPGLVVQAAGDTLGASGFLQTAGLALVPVLTRDVPRDLSMLPPPVSVGRQVVFECWNTKLVVLRSRAVRSASSHLDTGPARLIS